MFDPSATDPLIDDVVDPCACGAPMPGLHYDGCDEIKKMGAVVCTLGPRSVAVAVAALPAALVAYQRVARALRTARDDLAAVLTRAGEAAGPILSEPSTLELLFGVMNIANNEATRATNTANAVGHAAVVAGTRTGHEVNVALARGQARAMLECTCNKCEACGIRNAETTPEGALCTLTTRLLSVIEPSGLVTPDGAPIGRAALVVSSPTAQARKSRLS